MKTLLTLALLVGLAWATFIVAAQAQNAEPKKKPDAPAAPATPPQVYKNLSVEEFDKMRAEKNTVVLDVRTEKEFKLGHIPKAVNLDVNAKDFEAQIGKLDKEKTYLVHCAAGVRSMLACKLMAPLDIKKLYNLDEGFKAWEKAGKPVEK